MNIKEALLTLLLTCGFADYSMAQEMAPAPVPIITGGIGFITDFQKGHQDFGPKFEPVLLLPLGKRFLVEAEYSTELPISRDDGKLGPAVYSHGFEYLQLDYTASTFLTIVGGYFVSPFGIYKERMDPLWIRNFIQTPLLFPVNDNSSNGVMVRGGFFLTPTVKVNYAASYSAEVSNAQFSSGRQTNDRVGIFFPDARLEIGTSYSHHSTGSPFSMHGIDVSWRPKRLGVDIRGEGLWSKSLGGGYWLEAAHRLSRTHSDFARKSQLVVRGEQFLPKLGIGNFSPDLPSEHTTRLTFGWNYWATDTLRASFAVGREWNSASSTIASAALVYLFAFPGERNR